MSKYVTDEFNSCTIGPIHAKKIWGFFDRHICPILFQMLIYSPTLMSEIQKDQNIKQLMYFTNLTTLSPIRAT